MLFLLVLLSCGESSSNKTASQEASQSNNSISVKTAGKPSIGTTKEESTSSLHFSTNNIATLSFSLPQKENALSTPITPDPLHEAARNALSGMVAQHGVLIDNPWALLHALLALGPETKLPDGRDAIDALFSDYAELSFEGTLIHFPKNRIVEGKTILIEPHTDLALKVLTEIGVSPERIFTVQGTKKTFGDLYRSSLLEAHLDARTNRSSFASPNDTPWSIQALSTFAKPNRTWESAQLVMKLEDLTLFLMAVVHQETRFLAQAYANKQGFEKKKQGIFKYTCGGMHLIQALAYAHARGFGDEKSNNVITEQIVLLYYRFPIELSIYDELMQKHPDYKIQLLIQRLKFVGHFLETTAKLEILGFSQSSEQTRAVQKGALDQLALITEALRKEGLIQKPQSAATQQLYLDLIGDAAHAIYGADLIMGRRSIRF
jgi:hypothetical protein